jgi:integrase/recombinase XerD
MDEGIENGRDEDEGITIHSLRHTYASIAIANGADLKTLQQQLGHGSATVTLDTYAGLWPERLNKIADAVDQARSKALDES